MYEKTVINAVLFLIALLLLAPVDLPAPENENEKKNNGKIKPYEEVITEDAVSDEGLFNVHKVMDKYYFEIPFDLLEREILVVSRISGHVKGFNFGGAGMKSRPQQVIRWQRHDDKVLLRSVSFNSVADEEQPIYRSVRNNNFEPIVQTFAPRMFVIQLSATSPPIFRMPRGLMSTIRGPVKFWRVTFCGTTT